MDILAQLWEEAIKSFPFSEELFKSLNDLISPVGAISTIYEYAYLCQYLSQFVMHVGRNIMKSTLEKMDTEYRNSPSRKEQYYVKQTRERTIMTVFGEVTYKRTEYQHKFYRTSYIYVDEKIRLGRRMRFDNVVCSMAAEMYSDENSMIKVGKALGNMMHGYSLDHDDKTTAVSRQQVFNMINRVKRIEIKPERVKQTPETLFVMADEKYIALQYHTPAEDGEDRPRKRMNKLAVVFTGKYRQVRKDGKLTNRWELTDKYVFSYPDGDFWGKLSENMAYRYDMEKVKNIYVLGDGAAWIKKGAEELRTSDTAAKFALDRFHFGQAITRITKDKDMYDKLYDYALHGKRKDFKELCEYLINDNENKKDTIEKNRDYILSHITDIQTMTKEVKIGCAMEQAISHIFASVFTSVPKAYGEDHLITYIDLRVLQQNGFNIRKLWLDALAVQNEEGKAVIKETLDLSMFDPVSETYTYRDPNRARNHRVG